jgi:hypothetical protein
MTLRKLFQRVILSALACILFAALPVQPRAAVTASREHLTELEIDRVKEAQAIDKRTEVFIKAAERRLLAITNPNAAASKQVQKDMEQWGELPTGTRAELFGDLASILDEAINNIDDVATRDADSKLLPKALRKLAEASTRFISQLNPMRESAPNGPERDALENAIENAQSIIEAANKLPPPEPSTKKKK